LLVGYYNGRDLVYAGKVGTGFDTATLRSLHGQLSVIEQDTPASTGGDVHEPDSHWVRPKAGGAVGFTE
jgi:bifunctional non-homologous end joining protein LigD